MASYEVWLCNDAGVRVHQIIEYSYFSYARAVKGFGYIELGAPFDAWVASVPSVFQVDWRIDVWRSPAVGTPARREGSFLLRKYVVTTRADGVRMITLYGRSPLDILRRQYVDVAASVEITDYIDDIMKTVVTNYVINADPTLATIPSGEFVVDGDASSGPSTPTAFLLDNVLDALQNLQSASEALHVANSSDQKIYFDVVEDDTLVTNGFGYRFRTWAGLRGGDRTSGIEFSIENGNIDDPVYLEDHLDAFTSVELTNLEDSAAGASVQSPDRYLSRWNTIRLAQSTSETDPTINQTSAYGTLHNNSAKRQMNVAFVNSPGGPFQPQSLYGVDWDLGDLLKVLYAGKTMEVEVMIVYVSVNAQGAENIVGRNTIGE